ncbi:MAG: transposase [Dehalobacter sp.]|nr:transposase [Dehalobacter sp.]
MVSINEMETLRLLKAKAMLERGASIKYILVSNVFHVESESKPGTYHVVRHGKKDWSCDCPDHLKNNLKCKHILAVILISEELTGVNIDNRRETRGKAIATQCGQVIKVNDELYKVKSQSSNRYYEVKSTKDGVTCTCPDYIRWGGLCKHIIATAYYHEGEIGTTVNPISDIRITYTQNWKAYNEAQKEEQALFTSLLKDLLESIPEPEQRMGRPRIPLRESLFCSIQKVYSQLSSRRAYGLFEDAVGKGYIDHAPSFNIPSNLFNNPEITPILHHLVTLSALPVANLETDFAVDSTGFRCTTFGAYYGDKYAKKREHQWLKAHLITGTRTNIVTSVRITGEGNGDSPQFKSLVEETADNFIVREVSADMAYSSRNNLETVDKIGGLAYIPFKSNATGNASGSRLWKKAYHYFQLNRDEFMEHYHKRSNIEATNAAIKRKFGETLKSKNSTAQVNELLAKIVAYNLTVVIHEMYKNNVVPYFIQDIERMSIYNL